MQITSTISGNLFDSYKTNKKEAAEETQIVSRFMDIESQKADESELVMRSKTDALQSQVEQMKKEYLEGRNDKLDWFKFEPQKSFDELKQDYPMYYQATQLIVMKDTNVTEHGWDYVSDEHNRHRDYYGNMTHQYSKDDFRNAINNIEKAVTQILEQEFEKDPASDYANMLILFKAQVQAMPEVLEQINQQFSQLSKQNKIHGHDSYSEYATAIEMELIRLDKIAARIGNVHPELKEQLSDSVRILYDYYHSSFEDAFSLVDPNELDESFEVFVLNLSSRLSFIDNTEILLNLAADSSSLQTNNRESKSNEALIDRIRSKLKGTDDSILQQVMGKITNGVKTNGIGEGA